MGCVLGDQWKEERGLTAKAEGDYAESLRGVAGRSEHEVEKNRLSEESAAARVAYIDHLAQCAECRAELAEESRQLEELRKDAELYSALSVQALERTVALAHAAIERTSTSDDLLRAVVVMTHAYLEDFLRTIATRLLPLAGEEALNQVPLVGCAGDRGKFFLGKLAPHRSKTVDDVIRASVEQYLQRSNFNSTAEICSFLERLGIKLDRPEKELLPTLDKMIRRRHMIVHRADRAVGDGGATRELQAIDLGEVLNWIIATSNFMSGTVWSLLNSRFPEIPRPGLLERGNETGTKPR